MAIPLILELHSEWS